MIIIYCIALIVFGIALLVLEILILPGLIAGIIGVLFILFALSWVFSQYGTATGSVATFATLCATGIVLYFALRSKMWKRFSLTTSLQGNKMNVINSEEIKIGDTARALSALRPMGTIILNDVKYEAQTNGEHISADSIVVIVQILPNKVIVKSSKVSVSGME